MSNDLNQLQVTVVSEGGSLTVTPLSLLNYYLPNAKQVPGRPNVYCGKAVTETGERDVYLHVETMMSALMECKRKRLNPVADLYIIPANSPDKKSSHKVKYTVAIERCRKIPGFLGISSGLIVKRPKNAEQPKGEYDIVDTHGMTLPGDTTIGAWAEFFLAGLSKPIRHEVSLQQAKGRGPLWASREAFMIIKTVTDELLRLKVSPMFAGGDLSDEDEDEGESVILEAQTPEVMPGGGNGEQTSQGQPTNVSSFIAGTEYVGEILRVRLPAGKTVGAIEFRVEDLRVMCFFRKTPATMEDINLNNPIATRAAFSFTERHSQNGSPYRLLETFVPESAPEAQADDFDNHDGKEGEPKKETSDDRM